MTLAEPDHWCNFVKQNYAGLRLSRLSVASMIRVNKSMRQHEIASCNWHISWYQFLSVPIKLHPVKLMEPVLVDGRMCRVKTQLSLRIRLQISKYMECLIEVPDSVHRKVAR